MVGHGQHPLVADEDARADEDVGVAKDGGHPRVGAEVGLSRLQGVAGHRNDLALSALIVGGSRTSSVAPLVPLVQLARGARARRAAQLVELTGTLQLIVHHGLTSRASTQSE